LIRRSFPLRPTSHSGLAGHRAGMGFAFTGERADDAAGQALNEFRIEVFSTMGASELEFFHQGQRIAKHVHLTSLY